MNVLAVGSHFNNIEVGCSGALLKHAQKGDNIILFVAATAGMFNSEREETRKDDVVFRDAQEAAEILGGRLIFGGFETLHLEFDDPLNVKLVHLIEKEKIDLIYTHYKDDVHHDHMALAKASLHAGRHVPRILTYHSNWYQSDVRFTPDFYQDITDTWGTKEAVIKAHKSEYERVGDTWVNYFRKEAENNGFICGVKLAEGFRCVKWLA